MTSPAFEAHPEPVPRESDFLLPFAALSLPVHIAFNLGLIGTLFSHPTSSLVKTYGVATLAVHWLSVIAIFSLFAIAIPWRRVRPGFIVVGVCAISLYSQLDWMVYRCFHQHLTSFLRAGLLAQPDVIANIGLTPTAMLLPIAQLLLSCAAFWLAAVYARRMRAHFARRREHRRLLVTLTLLSLVLIADRAVRAFYIQRGNYFIAEYGAAIPFYSSLPITESWMAKLNPRMRSLAEIGDAVCSQALPAGGRADYKLRRKASPIQQPFHILVLVYESLRADAVDPDTMPALSTFAAKSARFLNHCSNAPATHFGLFSLHYSLYPCKWWEMREHRRPPLPLTLLRSSGYATCVVSTGSLDWYGMRDFMFSPAYDFVDDRCQVAVRERERKGEGYTADIDAVDEMSSLFARAEMPTFGMLFLNSTHFSYYYPRDCAVDQPAYDPYAPSTLNFSSEPTKIKNRYRNSLRWADKLFERLLGAIDLSRTVVVVTGDHGEMIGENNRFGHASGFDEGQLRVPMIIHIPDGNIGEYKKATSHVDVMPTLLKAIGAVPDARSGSFDTVGCDMFSADASRPFLAGNANVNSPDPTEFAVLTDRWKAQFRILNGRMNMIELLDRTDARLSFPLSQVDKAAIVETLRSFWRENAFR